MEKTPEYFLQKLPRRKLMKHSFLIQKEFEWLFPFDKTTAVEDANGQILITHKAEKVVWQQIEARFARLLPEDLKTEMEEMAKKIQAIQDSNKPITDAKFRIENWKIGFHKENGSIVTSATATNFIHQRGSYLYFLERKILFIEKAFEQKEFMELAKKWRFKKTFKKEKEPEWVEKVYLEIVESYCREIEQFLEKMNRLIQEKITTIRLTLQNEMDNRTKLGKWIDHRSKS